MDLTPRETLDTMLGYLGFIVDIQESETPKGLVLQVFSGESERLIGPEGQTLNDIQYLLNRLVQAHDRAGSRVVVDVEHYRTMREDGLVERVKKLAERVRATGRPIQLEPMNSYDRFIVHNLMKDDPDVMSWSPSDDARVKRISLMRRQKDA